MLSDHWAVVECQLRDIDEKKMKINVIELDFEKDNESWLGMIRVR